MKVNGENIKSAWYDEKTGNLKIINQNKLPFSVEIVDLTTFHEVVTAVKDMLVRGAPLLGAVAAYGMYCAFREAQGLPQPEEKVKKAAQTLKSTRPTAVDLFKSIEQFDRIINKDDSFDKKLIRSKLIAETIYNETLHQCWNIGVHGLELIQNIADAKNGETVNILTHCNAGWLATVDYGTATAPIYLAHKNGINLHVWVDETRPRNQGSLLTAFELGHQGVPHTVIADNTGGLLMQKGMVDMVIVGTDRVTRKGDVANKIGTYLKALAARENDIPFYVALPQSTFDMTIYNGLEEIIIEERSDDEVRFVTGWKNDIACRVQVTPSDSPVYNAGFDITPSHLVTALITDKGVCKASEKEILKLLGMDA